MATNFVDNVDEDVDVYWNLLHRLTIIIEGPISPPNLVQFSPRTPEN